MGNSGTNGSCGTKHLRLAALIIGMVLSIAVATFWHSAANLNAMDVRTRRIEQNDAANAARFEAIQDKLATIQRDLRRGAL